MAILDRKYTHKQFAVSLELYIKELQTEVCEQYCMFMKVKGI